MRLLTSLIALIGGHSLKCFWNSRKESPFDSVPQSLTTKGPEHVILEQNGEQLRVYVQPDWCSIGFLAGPDFVPGAIPVHTDQLIARIKALRDILANMEDICVHSVLTALADAKDWGEFALALMRLKNGCFNPYVTAQYRVFPKKITFLPSIRRDSKRPNTMVEVVLDLKKLGVESVTAGSTSIALWDARASQTINRQYELLISYDLTIGWIYVCARRSGKKFKYKYQDPSRLLRLMFADRRPSLRARLKEDFWDWMRAVHESFVELNRDSTRVRPDTE